MKKVLLTIIFAIFALPQIQAQEFVQFGIKGGLNFSNINYDSFVEKESRTGFHIGLLAEIPLIGNLSLQPEVLYSTQGGKGTEVMTGASPEMEYKFDYIQVPVLAKFYLIPSLALEAGPSFNFLVKEEVNASHFSAMAETGKDFEMGAALGVSFNLSRFLVNARYIQGLTNAYEEGGFEEDNKNSGFQIGVGLMF